MAENSMSRDLIKGGLTTIITFIITYFLTSAFKKEEFKKDDFEKEKQRNEAFEKTNKLLSDYVSRYDSLHSKYIDLINQKAGINPNNRIADNGDNGSNTPAFNAVSQSLLTGNWVTPDGSYSWNFSNNRLIIKGVGTYADSYEASGNYEVAGGVVNGTYHVSKFFYMAVNYSFRFEASINSDGNILYGTMTDGDGNVNTLALYKN